VIDIINARKRPAKALISSDFRIFDLVEPAAFGNQHQKVVKKAGSRQEHSYRQPIICRTSQEAKSELACVYGRGKST
jgi:hypothetical protein